MGKITTADIAKAGRTTVRAVHLWDEKGLLGTVERDRFGAREFGPEHLRKARLIAAGQMAGMSLAEIKVGVSVERIFEAMEFLNLVISSSGYDL